MWSLFEKKIRTVIFNLVYVVPYLGSRAGDNKRQKTHHDASAVTPDETDPVNFLDFAASTLAGSSLSEGALSAVNSGHNSPVNPDPREPPVNEAAGMGAGMSNGGETHPRILENGHEPSPKIVPSASSDFADPERLSNCNVPPNSQEDQCNPRFEDILSTLSGLLDRCRNTNESDAAEAITSLPLSKLSQPQRCLLASKMEPRSVCQVKPLVNTERVVAETAEISGTGSRSRSNARRPRRAAASRGRGRGGGGQRTRRSARSRQTEDFLDSAGPSFAIDGLEIVEGLQNAPTDDEAAMAAASLLNLDLFDL